MNTLVNCDCGHTLDDHHSDGGCTRCACARDRLAALDALVDALRLEGEPEAFGNGITRRTTSGAILRRLDFPAAR